MQRQAVRLHLLLRLQLTGTGPNKLCWLLKAVENAYKKSLAADRVCPSTQALQAFAYLCLADAQSITIYRASEKGNSAGLMASLASDTATLYRSAASTAQSVPYSSGSAKALRYMHYKAAAFQAYALALAGTAWLSHRS